MKNSYRKYLIAVVAVVVVLGLGYVARMKYVAMQNTPEALAKNQEDKKQRLLGLVGKVMVVPQEETTMLEVNNADQLKSQQAFFKDVQMEMYYLYFQKL